MGGGVIAILVDGVSAVDIMDIHGDLSQRSQLIADESQRFFYLFVHLRRVCGEGQNGLPVFLCHGQIQHLRSREIGRVHVLLQRVHDGAQIGGVFVLLPDHVGIAPAVIIVGLHIQLLGDAQSRYRHGGIGGVLHIRCVDAGAFQIHVGDDGHLLPLLGQRHFHSNTGIQIGKGGLFGDRPGQHLPGVLGHTAHNDHQNRDESHASCLYPFFHIIFLPL